MSEPFKAGGQCSDVAVHDGRKYQPWRLSMYPGYLIYQAERQLSDAEQREADRHRGELAKALAEVFRRRRARTAAGHPQCPACAHRAPGSAPAGLTAAQPAGR
jgi:hypothetical protein